MKLPALFVVRNWKEFFLLCGLVITCIGCWKTFPTSDRIDKEFFHLHHCENTDFFITKDGVFELDYKCREGLSMKVLVPSTRVVTQ